MSRIYSNKVELTTAQILDRVEMPDELALLNFTHEGTTCRVIPHPDDDYLAIEAEALQLTEEDPPRELILMLHQMNFVQRLSDRTLASISGENVLVVSKCLASTEATGVRIAEEMVSILDKAQSLRELWLRLREPEPAMPKQDPEHALRMSSAFLRA